MPDAPLPTLFGEGTGRMRSLGPGPIAVMKGAVRSAQVAGLLDEQHPTSYDPLYNERRYVAMNLRDSRGIGKIELPHDMGAESNFYHGNLSLVTPHYIEDGHSLGYFLCGNIDENSGKTICCCSADQRL